MALACSVRTNAVSRRSVWNALTLTKLPTMSMILPFFVDFTSAKSFSASVL